MHTLDATDRRLLRRLLERPDAAPAELAQGLGISAQGAWRRVERMRAAGFIRGVRAVIDWRALGYTVEVSLRVTLDKSRDNAFDRFLAEARKVPEITEIQTFLGRVDARLNVIARDMAHYRDIYRERILALPHVADIEALMLLSTIHETETLPL